MERKEAHPVMGKRILRRLTASLATIFMIITISFLMVRFMPGNVMQHLIGQEEYYYLMEAAPEQLEMLEEKYGLNGTIGEQYIRYLKCVVTLDFGISYGNKLPVAQTVGAACRWTLVLSIPALILGGLLGGFLGVFAGWNPGKPFDMILTPIALFVDTLPSNCIGVLVLVVFAFKLRWFPISGMVSGTETDFWKYILDVLRHAALPLGIIILYRIAGDFILMKSCISQIRNEEYIITAHAKGLSEKKVLLRHVLKNALLPYITSMCMQMGHLLSGSMIIETIFGWKGMGKLFYDAVSNRDYPTAQLCFLISAACVVTANLLSDILITFIDPRIKEKVRA